MRRRELLTLLAAAPFVGCHRRSLADDAPIEVLATSEAATIDPRYSSDVYGLRISRLVHATLAAPHVDSLEPTPWLAESMADDEGGALVVTLRDDARFHDDTKVRAGDVVASFAALADPAMRAPARRIVELLASVTAIDGEAGLRVRFVPKTPRAILRHDLDLPITKASEARLARGSRLTGCGPYAVLDSDPAAISLAPAASYGAWGSGGAARRPVIVRTVRDEAARALRVLGGGSDVAPNAFAPMLALSLPGHHDAKPGLSVRRRPAPTTTYLTFHLEHAPLDRPEVRAAIASALDVPTLITAKLGGAATIARGFVPSVVTWAQGETPPRALDLAGARTVLAPFGAAGARLTMLVSSQRPRVALARAIAQMIGDAGLPVDVRPLELATLTSRLNAGNFDLALQQAVEVDDPELLRWYVGSSAVPPGGANRGRIRDADVDALLDRGLSTLTTTARAPIYRQLEQLIRERALLCPLFHEDHVAVVSHRAGAFTPSADGRWSALARV